MARENGDASGHAEHKHTAAQHDSSPYLSRSLLTTAGVIGVAALLQPELLVGMAIGAGAAMASGWLPDVFSGAVAPVLKTAIKAGYSAASMAREMISEASERNGILRSI